MKLSNLEIEINRVCNAVCGHDRKDCPWLAYGPGEACNQIQELEASKPEDAIPIEWLTDIIDRTCYANKNDDINGVRLNLAARLILDRWRKEEI